jgi:hypothetical protein
VKYRPRSLLLLAAKHILIGLSLPVQIFWLYGHPLSEWDLVLQKLTVLNWAVILTCMTSAVLIFRTTTWALLSVPIAMITVGLNNYYVALYATDFAPLTCLLATFGFWFGQFPLITPRNWSIMTERNKQWWRTATRRKISLPISLGTEAQWAFEAKTFDVSETGVFVAMESDHLLDDFGLGPQKEIRLKIENAKGEPVFCKGQIVRRSPANGNYPAGVGIRFTEKPSRLSLAH